MYKRPLSPFHAYHEVPESPPEKHTFPLPWPHPRGRLHGLRLSRHFVTVRDSDEERALLAMNYPLDNTPYNPESLEQSEEYPTTFAQTYRGRIPRRPHRKHPHRHNCTGD